MVCGSDRTGRGDAKQKTGEDEEKAHRDARSCEISRSQHARAKAALTPLAAERI
jgi:hypothetical protein